MRFAPLFSAILIAIVTSSSPGRAVEQLPDGITTRDTDLGRVFADKDGMTLYFARRDRRNSESVTSNCLNIQHKTGKGQAHSPNIYGLIRQDNRPTCMDKTPPLVALEGTKPVGKWDFATRKDGLNQWAFDGRPVYRSIKDVAPGDVNGTGEPAYVPIPVIPGVRVHSDGYGQRLETENGMTLYTYDRDRPNRSACENGCERTWHPLLTGMMAVSTSPEWTLVRRADGTKQWAFQGKPLYTNVDDIDAGTRNGEGVANWRLALVKPGVGMPPEVATRVTWLGQVFTDAKGFTLYRYHCTDLSVDNLPCDDPDDRSNEWFAYCGTPERCATQFRPLLAPTNAKGWRTKTLSPCGPTAAVRCSRLSAMTPPANSTLSASLPGATIGMHLGRAAKSVCRTRW
jgi:predicted lipoprotein with Yx(FWY)xxD motif